jgi:gamma-glutamyl phosphate reductase
MNDFQNEILAANQVDIDNAKKSGISGPMLSRLALSTGKLQSLSAGLLQVQKARLFKTKHFFSFINSLVMNFL